MIMYDPEIVYSNIKVTIGTQTPHRNEKKKRGHQHVAYETYQRTPTNLRNFEVFISSMIGCCYYIKYEIFEKGRRKKKKEATSGIRTYHHNREGMGVGHTYTFTVTGNQPPSPHLFKKCDVFYTYKYSNKLARVNIR